MNNKLFEIQSKLKIKYGTFRDELSEQIMASLYLTGNEKVLEIGGNIGRNSLIISSILEDDKNLIVFESDNIIASQLKENRDLNNKNFHIENCALSKKKLIQKGWNTVVSNVLKPGYKWVNTITLDEVKKKYNIDFDTLVLDCEGAFYHILKDMPEILDNINLIIMENDYRNADEKIYVDNILEKNGLYLDYINSLNMNVNWCPCKKNFFEVWKRKSKPTDFHNKFKFKK
jgi:FkbM family methyltransferase